MLDVNQRDKAVVSSIAFCMEVSILGFARLLAGTFRHYGTNFSGAVSETQRPTTITRRPSCFIVRQRHVAVEFLANDFLTFRSTRRRKLGALQMW